MGFGRGRPCFMRHLVLGFRNQRGYANDTCLDGSSVALGELANGHVRAESGSIACDGASKAYVWHSVAP